MKGESRRGFCLAPHTPHLAPVLGFTLIELVLVASVIAILLAASIPQFVQTAQRLRIEQQAFALTQQLRYAHELAVSEANEIIWMWDPTARQAQLLQVLTGADRRVSIQKASGRAATSPTLDESASLGSPNERNLLGCPADAGGADCVHFFPDGTSESVTLPLHAPARAYTIQVDGATSQVVLKTGFPAR